MNRKAIFKIAVHYCWEDKRYTKFFFSLVEEGLLRLSHFQYTPFLKLFSKLTSIEDSLQTFRLEYGLVNVILENIEEYLYDKPAAIQVCVNYLVKMANKKEKFRKKLFDYKSKINALMQSFGFKISYSQK
jgi:hypothetical protein